METETILDRYQLYNLEATGFMLLSVLYILSAQYLARL